MTRIPLLAAAFLGLAAVPALADDVLTGCLQNGRLTDLAIGSTPARPCRPDAQQVTLAAGQQPFQTPFFVAMNVGDDDIVLGQNGPLEVVARCFTSPTSGLDRSRLLIRSAVDGWSLTQAVEPTVLDLVNLPAGERAIGGLINSGPEIRSAFGGSAIAPTGEVLTVAGDTSLVGMHVLADFDCVMSGVVTTISQTVEGAAE